MGRGAGAGAGGARIVGLGELDALVRATVVSPLVRFGGVVVLDLDGVDVHGEGSLAVVGLTASPLNGALAVVRITTSPDTNPHVHGSLRESGAALGLIVRNGTDFIAIDAPLDVVLGPVDRVGVPGVDRSIDRGIRFAVIGGGITFSEVVGLDLVVVATKTLLWYVRLAWSQHGNIQEPTHPVDLVEIIRLQHNAADNAGSRGNLHFNIDSAEEQVAFGLNGGCVTLLGDGELSTVIAKVHFTSGGLPSVQGGLTLAEVRLEGGGTDARIRRACL